MQLAGSPCVRKPKREELKKNALEKKKKIITARGCCWSAARAEMSLRESSPKAAGAVAEPPPEFPSFRFGWEKRGEAVGLARAAAARLAVSRRYLIGIYS